MLSNSGEKFAAGNAFVSGDWPILDGALSRYLRTDWGASL